MPIRMGWGGGVTRRCFCTQETCRRRHPHTPGLEGQQALEDHSGGGVGGWHDAGNDANGLSHLLDAVLQGGALQRGRQFSRSAPQLGWAAACRMLQTTDASAQAVAMRHRDLILRVHLSPTHLWVVLNDVAGLEVLVLVVDVLAGKVVLDDLWRGVSAQHTACVSAQLVPACVAPGQRERCALAAVGQAAALQQPVSTPTTLFPTLSSIRPMRDSSTACMASSTHGHSSPQFLAAHASVGSSRGLLSCTAVAAGNPHAGADTVTDLQENRCMRLQAGVHSLKRLP